MHVPGVSHGGNDVAGDGGNPGPKGLEKTDLTRGVAQLLFPINTEKGEEEDGACIDGKVPDFGNDFSAEFGWETFLFFGEEVEALGNFTGDAKMADIPPSTHL